MKGQPTIHMPVEAFIGGNGDVVLLQEITQPDGETFIRIMVDPKNCAALCAAITAAAREGAEAHD
ncbi:hypothetical protein [Rhodopseudomonas pseudopalustris]|uniref:Uncharacterized protein n=1 Tax=Rhodopseudomonas pseudopalustris TaxID=1513892 RepID=A0A1H8VYJ1_9BRAD|nr:hypothetical protein [Rhodopseudomonas pseudopalustris]SEP19988.1 hypothetical protein SAMN05444123_11014 [Rhodopseudomonas pseudopalustris]